MSGALKHFFDGIFYPCLEATRRRPYGLYVHGGMDTTRRGARGSSRSPPACSGAPYAPRSPSPARLASPDLEACWELAAPS